MRFIARPPSRVDLSVLVHDISPQEGELFITNQTGRVEIVTIRSSVYSSIVASSRAGRNSECLHHARVTLRGEEYENQKDSAPITESKKNGDVRQSGCHASGFPKERSFSQEATLFEDSEPSSDTTDPGRVFVSDLERGCSWSPALFIVKARSSVGKSVGLIP